MRRTGGRFRFIAMAAPLLSAFLVLMLAPGLAETTPVPQASPLVQCNIALFLPLLLAGLAFLAGRSNVQKKK